MEYDEHDEYDFDGCRSCGRVTGEQEWDGECSDCEFQTVPCRNSAMGCENQIYVEGEECLRCEKVRHDAELDDVTEVRG